MFIVKYKKFFIGLSILLVIGAGLLMNTYGIKRGIDFTGGSVIDITYEKSVPTLDAKTFADADMTLYKTGDNTYRFVSTKTYEEISPVISNLGNINSATPFVFTQVSTVGPTLGNEMTKKAIIAIVVVILAILAFIAFSFREVSLPVSSWKY